MQKEKNLAIECSKVIAIAIVVLNHSGLVIPYVNFWGGMFFVSAFFLLSGYTYTFRPEESYGAFVSRKARRLLVPYVVTNALLFAFFFLKEVVTGVGVTEERLLSLAGILYGRNQVFKVANDGVVYLYTNLNAPTWFLLALFLTLIGTDGLLRLSHGQVKKVSLMVAIYALFMVIYAYTCNVLLPWCLDVLPFFMIFFLVGWEMKKRGVLQKSCPIWKKMLIIVAVLFITATAGLINGSFNLSISSFGRSITLMLLSSLGACTLLLFFTTALATYVPKLARFIGRLAPYTLTILCWHYFILQMSLAVCAVIISYIPMPIDEMGDYVTTGQVALLWIVPRVVSIVVAVTVCVLGQGLYQNFRTSHTSCKKL